MWPKAFAQLVELAPHISRLLPMADRYFQARNTVDDSSRSAMEGLAEGLRKDVAQMHMAQGSLQRQLASFGEGLTTSSTNAREARVAAESAAKASAAAAQSSATAAQSAADTARFTADTARVNAETAKSAAAHAANVDTRLAGLEGQLEKLSDRARLSPIVLLLVLANLILLACVITLLVRGSH